MTTALSWVGAIGLVIFGGLLFADYVAEWAERLADRDDLNASLDEEWHG